jgi:WhiB family redox-sensing transcriptional regulator
VSDSLQGVDYSIAPCRGVDPEIFFPDKNESGTEARKYCNRCDQTHQCIALAFKTGERRGIFGGLNFKQRMKYRDAYTKEHGVFP